MRLISKHILIVLLSILSYSASIGQSLSGIWEGSYTHFFPTCCDEYSYKFRLKIYEDQRGAMWIEAETRPFADNHAIGQLFSVGYRLPDGKIIVADVRETFSSLSFVTSCFNRCTWCIKESLLTYSKQGRTEMLTGLWNSKRCYPGGEVSLTKVAELANGDDVELMKLGRAEDKYFDAYRLAKKPLRIYPSENPNEIRFALPGWFSSAAVKVDNIEDFEDEDSFVLQNVTMRIKDGYQSIIYLEIKDKRNGKVYPINPDNISKEEIMDLAYSPSGLTFPNKAQWEKLMGDKLKPADEKAEKTTPIEQIKERPIEIRKDAISIGKSAKIYVEVWDNNIEDGDIISLFVNDKCVLSSYRLTKDKYRLYELPLQSGKNIITMYAENLGSIPPNTAAMNVYAGDKLVKSLILKSDMNTSEAIELNIE